MPTKIKQIDHADSRFTSLRIEGEMFSEDAELLERIAMDLVTDKSRRVTIDLADLDFLDSEAATFLKRLEHHEGISIEGIEIFLQSVVNDVERGRIG